MSRKISREIHINGIFIPNFFTKLVQKRWLGNWSLTWTCMLHSWLARPSLSFLASFFCNHIYFWKNRHYFLWAYLNRKHICILLLTTWIMDCPSFFFGRKPWPVTRAYSNHVTPSRWNKTWFHVKLPTHPQVTCYRTYMYANSFVPDMHPTSFLSHMPQPGWLA